MEPGASLAGTRTPARPTAWLKKKFPPEVAREMCKKEKAKMRTMLWNGGRTTTKAAGHGHLHGQDGPGVATLMRRLLLAEPRIRTPSLLDSWDTSSEIFIPEFLAGFLLLHRAGLDAAERANILAAIRAQFGTTTVARALREQWMMMT